MANRAAANSFGRKTTDIEKKKRKKREKKKESS